MTAFAAHRRVSSRSLFEAVLAQLRRDPAPLETALDEVLDRIEGPRTELRALRSP